MMSKTNPLKKITDNIFIEQVAGQLSGLLSWAEFDQVCEYIMQNPDMGWYLYTIDEQPPQQTATDSELNHFITSLNKNIHKEYARDHCGIAFVDSKTEPALIKIFNPKLLKSICYVNGTVPLHGWVISRQKPVDLHAITPVNTISLYDKNRVTKVSKILDARRTGCPLPVINTCRALQDLSRGQLLEIMTIEPGAVKDVSIICGHTGDKLVSHDQTCDGYSFFVEKM
jgi:TusA-related sulfurtransferase